MLVHPYAISLCCILFLSKLRAQPVRNISLSLTPGGARQTCPTSCSLTIRYCITEDARRCNLVTEKETAWDTEIHDYSIEMFYSYEPTKQKPMLKIDVLLDSQVTSSFIRGLSSLSKEESSLLATESKYHDIYFSVTVDAVCTFGYFGKSCERKCLNPPDNRYKCKEDGSKECAKGYWFYEKIDECYPVETRKDQCQNNGVPRRDFPVFKCECTKEFLGPSCIERDVCYLHKCERLANCIRRSSGQYNYTCDCPADYLAPFCKYFNPCHLISACPKPQECHLNFKNEVPEAECRCPRHLPSNCSELLVNSPQVEMNDASSLSVSTSSNMNKISPVIIVMVSILFIIVVAVIVVGIAIQNTKKKPTFHFNDINDVPLAGTLGPHRCSMSRSTFEGYHQGCDIRYGEDDEIPLAGPIRSSNSTLTRQLSSPCQGYFSVPTSMMHISHPSDPSIHNMDPAQSSLTQRLPPVPRGGGYMSLPIPMDNNFTRPAVGGPSGYPVMVSGHLCSPEKVYSPLVRVMEQEESDLRLGSSIPPGHETAGSRVFSGDNFTQGAYLGSPTSADSTHFDPASSGLLAIDV